MQLYTASKALFYPLIVSLHLQPIAILSLLVTIATCLMFRPNPRPSPHPTPSLPTSTPSPLLLPLLLLAAGCRTPSLLILVKDSLPISLFLQYSLHFLSVCPTFLKNLLQFTIHFFFAPQATLLANAVSREQPIDNY